LNSGESQRLENLSEDCFDVDGSPLAVNAAFIPGWLAKMGLAKFSIFEGKPKP
jgi:hypothetical protein